MVYSHPYMTKKNPHQTVAYIESALKAGLSAKAASVYVALLEAGVPISPKNIIVRTSLHRQYVYDAIRELQDRSLITSTGKDRSVRYAAVSPDKLVQEVEKRRNETLDGVHLLMQLYDRSPAGAVEIIRGKVAVVESELNRMEASTLREHLELIGDYEKWKSLLGERFKKWDQHRIVKRIGFRTLGGAPGATVSRVVPGTNALVSTLIRPESVSFIMYEPEVLLLRVRSNPAAESHQALFEALWRAAG